MKRAHILLLFAPLLFTLVGCAAQQHTYEKPLHDLQVVGENDSSAPDLAEISSEDISNMKPGQRPPLNSDEAGIWMVMDNFEEDLKSSGHLYRAPKLQHYIQGVIKRLTPEYAEDIRIYLVRIPYFNASMAPNGCMQIWTGLFLRVSNEAELASILGHEIAHYLRRHSVQQLRKAITATNSALFINIVAGLSGVPDAGQLVQLATIGLLQANSREFEREADGYGLALLSRAGYDPRASATVWERLIAEREADDDSRQPPLFLATHPPSSERNQALHGLAEKIIAAKGEALELGRDQYLSHTLIHRKEFLRDELHLRNFDRTKKVLEVLLEQNANPAEILYFKGELFRLRAEEGDRDRALNAYQQAITAKGTFAADLYKSMAQLYRKAGRNQEASLAYKKYLSEAPEAFDKEMILHTIKRLSDENN
jgi:predicted Zn-dependent protease